MSVVDRLVQQKELPVAPSNGADHEQLVRDIENANYAQHQRFLVEFKAETVRLEARLSEQLKEWETGIGRARGGDRNHAKRMRAWSVWLT